MSFISPIFQEIDNYVVATLKHTSIASSEEQVLEYLKNHESVNNSEARKLTGEEDKVRMKNVFLRLLKQKKIEIINPDAPRLKRRYRLIKEQNRAIAKSMASTSDENALDDYSALTRN